MTTHHSPVSVEEILWLSASSSFEFGTELPGSLVHLVHNIGPRFDHATRTAAEWIDSRTAFKEIVTRFEAAMTSRRLKFDAQDGRIMDDDYFKDELDSLLLCILETTVRVIDQLLAMPPDREVTALELVELCLWAQDPLQSA